ncbi:PAS domain S-box protein [Mycolicibacterium grossiae]|nr:PAS domain-containing protein [Mycolicibacterium grossiae]
MSDEPSPPRDFERLFDEAPCGYIVTTSDRRIRRANATVAQWLGMQPYELTGLQLTDLMTVGSRIHFETHFASLIEVNPTMAGVAVDLRHADGDAFPVYLAAAGSRDSFDHIVELRFTLDDARDRRSYERELLEAQRRADDERRQVELLAGTLRRSLVPSALCPPAGLEASAYFHAASTADVGGDLVKSRDVVYDVVV